MLPKSGKSIYEKFNLNKKKRPVVFVSVKVGPPKQVPEKHLETGGMLMTLLKQMLEPHAAKRQDEGPGSSEVGGGQKVASGAANVRGQRRY